MKTKTQFSLKATYIAVCAVVAMSSVTAVNDAYAQPVRNSSLYYRMGGNRATNFVLATTVGM